MTREQFFRSTVEAWDVPTEDWGIPFAPASPEDAVWSHVAKLPASARRDRFDALVGRAATLLDPHIRTEVINAIGSARLSIDVLAS